MASIPDTYLLYIEREKWERTESGKTERKTSRHTIARGTRDEILEAKIKAEAKHVNDDSVSIGWERDYSSYPKKYITASSGRGFVVPVVCIGTKEGSTFWQSAVWALSAIIREERPNGKRARFHYIPQGFPARVLGLDPVDEATP